MTFQRMRMFVRFLTCFLLLVAVAAQRNERILGHDLTETDVDVDSLSVETVTDGITVVNTSTLADDIKGYGGPVPLEISIKDNKIVDITALRNSESEAFFKRVRECVIPEWIGTDVDDVLAKNVDAVTGATLSSNAVNANVKAAIAYLENNAQSVADQDHAEFMVKTLVILLVVLCGAVLPLFVRNKRYRYVQLALNVLILGLWSGTFLSYEVFVNYVANGLNVWHSLVWLLMLIVAFVYPYFGHKSHYCSWICPLGSLQELAGRSVRYKLKLSPRTVKRLTTFQEILWFALMFVMCAGLWFDWMNWELFTAFIFKQAAVGVLIAAVAFIALSFVVMRPYCRFVCPTGCLFQITQNPDK